MTTIDMHCEANQGFTLVCSGLAWDMSDSNYSSSLPDEVSFINPTQDFCMEFKFTDNEDDMPDVICSYLEKTFGCGLNGYSLHLEEPEYPNQWSEDLFDIKDFQAWLRQRGSVPDFYSRDERCLVAEYGFLCRFLASLDLDSVKKEAV